MGEGVLEREFPGPLSPGTAVAPGRARRPLRTLTTESLPWVRRGAFASFLIPAMEAVILVRSVSGVHVKKMSCLMSPVRLLSTCAARGTC